MTLAPVKTATWMTALPDRTRLVDLLLPGTHDTATFGNGWLAGAGLVQTQQNQSDFSTQLQGGVRFWDLRVKKISDDPARQGKNLQLFHGIANTNKTLGDALSSAKAFLETNPSETLVICLKQEGNGLAEKAKQPITASDVQAYLNQYQRNAALNSNLWVAGFKDFQDLIQQRSAKSLDDLNRNPSFQLNIASDPRQQLRETGAVKQKLNYGALTLGDVRGKIVLMVRDFTGYDGSDTASTAAQSWKTSTIAALDTGLLSSGVWSQDNYSRPSYEQKKNDIVRALKGEGQSSWGGAALQQNDFIVNFSSATGNFVDKTPARYALNINSGAAKNNYTTDGTGTLTNWLQDAGSITTWNANQKRAGKPGARGGLAADYIQAPQSWYEKYDTQKVFLPDPNSADFAADGPLPWLIARQNAFIAVKPSAQPDRLTGLPTFKEGSQGSLVFHQFMGNPDKLGFRARISRVDGLSAGVAAKTLGAIKIAAKSDDVLVSYTSPGQSNPTPFALAKPTTTLNPLLGDIAANKGILNFRISDDNISQGYRFYQIDALTPGSTTPMAAPVFFAITDT